MVAPLIPSYEGSRRTDVLVNFCDLVVKSK